MKVLNPVTTYKEILKSEEDLRAKIQNMKTKSKRGGIEPVNQLLLA